MKHKYWNRALMLAVGFIVLLVAGCEDGQRKIDFKQNNDRAFSACVDSGGVPIQSWFNHNVLGDCKYPPNHGN